MVIPNLSAYSRSTAGSFQVDLFEVDDGKLTAKVYRREKVWDVLDLGDPVVREEILGRELRCLSHLAATLDPMLAQVELPNGELDTALVIRSIPSKTFLHRRLRAGETIPRAALVAVADSIADFHFDSSCCAELSIKEFSLRDFLVELFSVEHRHLRQHQGAIVDEEKLLDHLFASLIDYIGQNGTLIDQHQIFLGEPIVGHGDLRAANIAFSAEGVVSILNSVPYHPWRIAPRRFDAMFVRADLSIAGHAREADLFWTRYNARYREHYTMRSVRITPELEHGIEVLDRIALFYRTYSLYKLAAIGQTHHDRETCMGHLVGLTPH